MEGGILKEKKEFYQKDLFDKVVKAIIWTTGVTFFFLLFGAILFPQT